MIENDWPALVIDSAGVDQLSEFPRSNSVEEVLSAVWGRGEHTAFMPSDRDEVDAIVRACLRPGKVNLLVDEAHTWLSARKGAGSPLLTLMRAHRHARANVLLTTQHLTGDVPAEATSCAPVFYVFRCTALAVLERLRTLGVDADKVQTLPQGSWIRHYEGF